MAKKTVGAKSSLSRANLDPSICETGICSISEMEFAYQEYIASAYSAAMLEKRYKEGVAAGIAELLAMVEKVEKQIQIYHFTSAKAGVVLEVLGAIRSVEEECTSSAPVMEVGKKGMHMVEDMVHNLEKTINQLPVRNVQNMSQAEKESLETTLEELNASFDECLQNYEMVRKKWTRYAEILKVITEDNMLVFKKRCDDLMKRLSDISLKLSSLRAAETAREFLKI